MVHIYGHLLWCFVTRLCYRLFFQGGKYTENVIKTGNINTGNEIWLQYTRYLFDFPFSSIKSISLCSFERKYNGRWTFPQEKYVCNALQKLLVLWILDLNRICIIVNFGAQKESVLLWTLEFNRICFAVNFGV